MSSRVSIGGASYNLTLEDRQFVRQLQNAERTAQQRAATIRRNLAALPLGHPDVERFRRDLQRAEQAAARASAEIRQRLGQIGPAASATSRLMSNSFVAGFGSMVAASAGLFAIINTFKGIAQATRDAAVAQRGLNAQFGAATASDLAAFTDQLATATARGRTETKQAAAVTATLARNYGFTTEEIKTVIAASNDLAAASGKGVADATQRVTAALRGETESSEALGLSLQMAALKGSDALTASEKARLETMGNVEGAHVRLRVLLEQAAFAQGEAAKQAELGTDNFAKLDAATANLNTTMAESTSINAIPGVLAQAATSAENLIKILDILNEREQIANRLRAEAQAQQGFGGAGSGPLELSGDMAANLNKIAEMIGKGTVAGRDFWKEAERIQQETLAAARTTTTMGGVIAALNTGGAQGQLRDLTAELKAAEAAGQALAATIADDHAALARRQDVLSGVAGFGPTLAERTIAAQETADSIVKANQDQARRIGAAQATADDAAIKSAERTRDARLQAAEDVRDGALAALDAEKAGADAHFDALRQQYQDDRDARLKSLADARDAAIETNEAAAQAVSESFDQQIDDAERARDAQTAAQEDIRDSALDTIHAEQDAESARRQQEDRDRSDSLRAEDRARADARTAEGLATRAAEQAFAEDAKRRQAAIEDTRDTALAAIEAEKEARQRQSDGIMAALDAQQAAEQQRHAAAVANITREEQAAVAALQRRLGLLDAADKRRQDAAQGRSLREGISDARSGLRDARASGDPDAIRRAEKQAADAREAVRSAALKRAEDAERVHIQAQITGVQAEAHARREAEDTALAAAQQRIEAEKRGEQERLTVALEALATRGEATTANADAGLATLRAATEATKANAEQQAAAVVARYAAEDRAREDTRLANDRALEDSRAAADRIYAARTATVNATYDNEIEKIRQAFTDEETGVIPKFQQAKEESDAYYDSKREGIDDTYQTETEQVAALYDGPTGLLRQLETAKTNSDAYFDSKRRGIDSTYENETKLVKALYDGEDGLIAKLKATKEAHDKWMDKAIDDWGEWGKKAKESLDDANPRLAELLEKLEKLQGLGATVIGVTGTDAGQDDASIPSPTRTPRSTGSGGASASARGNGTHVFPLPNYSGNEPHATYHVPGATDLFMPEGTPVYAVHGGAVTYSANAANGGPGGNSMTISGDDGLDYYYAHMLSDPPRQGARIQTGQTIGQVSDTGNARGTGAHLHIGIGHGISSGTGDAAGAGANFDAQGFLAGLLSGEPMNLPGIPGMVQDVVEQFALDLFGKQVSFEVRTPGGLGWGIPNLDDLSGAAAGSSREDVEAYILAKAASLSYVYPPAAVGVWTGEGKVTDSGQSNSMYQGARERSYGPFQLFYDGGEGNTFSDRTNIWPGDARFEQASIDYALARAKVTGWGPWHGSPYADPWYGITRMAAGGVIPEPSYISSLATGKPYAIAGEAGPEIVAPMHGGGDLYLQVSVGGRVLEDFTISVMDTAQRDGRWRAVPRA